MGTPTEMWCAVGTGPSRVEIQRRPVPVPGPDEVLVRMCEVGICGGDLRQFKKETPGVSAAGGVIPGRAGVGVVVGAGADVEGVEIGERVALGSPRGDNICGACEWCRAGLTNLRPHLCRQIRISPTKGQLASSRVFPDGDCAEYMTYPTSALTAIPASLTWDQAAQAQGLAPCMYALERPRHRIGETVAVFGLGCAGFYFGMLEARFYGASTVIMVGRSRNRLDHARDLGFVAIDSGTEDAVARIMELTDGEGVDLVVDTTGADEVLAASVIVARKLGSVLIYAPGSTQMNMEYVLKKELAVLGVAGTVPISRALRLIEQRLIDVDGIITHHFPLDRTQEAFELALSADKASAGYIKGAIVCSQELLDA